MLHRGRNTRNGRKGTKMDSEVFATLPLRKLLWRCAVPSMVTMVFGALFSVADGLFVGRFIGEDALAAINLMMPILMMVDALSNMIATGSSVQISILLGEKKRQEASAVFTFSIKALLVINTVLGVIGFLFAEPFVRLISPGATEESINYAVQYLRVFAAFCPVYPIYFCTDNYLRVCGKERLSMWLTIVTQLLNIILDAILIAGLGFGIKAAALTSCIAMTVGALATLWLFTGKKLDVYYTKETISMRKFLAIVYNGSSEFFSTIASSVMSVIMNLFLLHYGGTVAVAAFSVVMYVDSIMGMSVFGLCDSLQPSISYCYGAGLLTRVKSIFKMVVFCALVLSAGAMLFMFFAGEYVAPLFIEPGNTELLQVSIEAMKLFSVSYLVGWMDMCFSSLFTALDKAGRSLIVSFFGTLVFPILFLVILTQLFGLKGVWLMPTAAGLASGILSVILAATMKLDTSATNPNAC